MLTRCNCRDAKGTSSTACHSRGFVPPSLFKHELKPEKEKENRTLHITNCSEQEQIDDLAVMSREYEKQEATRMAHNSSGASTSSSSSDNSVAQSEPYINEIIPISQPGGRRREPDSRGGR